MSGSEPLPIIGIDHLHLVVGNAFQAAYFYRAAFGFELKAWRGPQTGTPDHVSYVLEQGGIRLVLSSPLVPSHPTYDHIRRHGDGIRDIAFAVADPAAAWKTAIERGAESSYEPSALEDEQGILRMSGIRVFGDTIHSFVGRSGYSGAFRPGYAALGPQDQPSRSSGLLKIAGLTACIAAGEVRRWAALYEKALGFGTAGPVVGSSARLTKAFTGDTGTLALTFAAAEGEQAAAVGGFLDAYQGAGVQCVALATHDPAAVAQRLTSQGVEFAEVAGGLVTKPVHDRPTLRFEIVAG